MNDFIEAMEKTVNYSFKKKSLLEEALTRSLSSISFEPPSFERLQFLGTDVLRHAFTKYIYLTYPELKVKDLEILRHANICNLRLARLAVKHGLYKFLSKLKKQIDREIKAFAEEVCKEDDRTPYIVCKKPPIILTDVVHSVAGAVYVDVNFDTQRFWEIFKGLLEPIFAPHELPWQSNHPMRTLSHWGEEQGKRVEYKIIKLRKEIIGEVYIDDELIASGSSRSRIESAKQRAARGALLKLSASVTIEIPRKRKSSNLIGSVETPQKKKQKKTPQPLTCEEPQKTQPVAREEPQKTSQPLTCE